MKVIVKSYKPSGKWYHTQETQIELQTIDDVLDLEEKIKCNDESIQHLSGLKQGFSRYFTYMIELKSDNLFMDFIIHSNEFIRNSEVLSEKEKNEKLEECNDTLFKAIEEVNRINKKLKAENKKLKEKLFQVADIIEPLHSELPEDRIIREIFLIVNDCSNKKVNPYKQALIEIKEIAESYTTYKMDWYFGFRNILQKINECGVENA